MLRKYSIFMMLLLATGSLIGISSIYQPANVETQPESPQQLQGRSIGIRIAPEDKQLLDRLLPSIIRGTVESKYFLDRLMQSLDSKTFAEKVLPYLDISTSVRQANGPTSILKVGGGLGLNTALEPRSSAAQCNKGEIAIGGGFSFRSDPEDSYVSSVLPTQQNGWTAGALMGDNGEIKAYATCLTVKVALKSPAATPVSPAWKSLAQQQGLPQQLQPSQPPGAAPQQPPGGPIIK